MMCNSLVTLSLRAATTGINNCSSFSGIFLRSRKRNADAKLGMGGITRDEVHPLHLIPGGSSSHFPLVTAGSAVTGHLASEGFPAWKLQWAQMSHFVTADTSHGGCDLWAVHLHSQSLVLYRVKKIKGQNMLCTAKQSFSGRQAPDPPTATTMETCWSRKPVAMIL